MSDLAERLDDVSDPRSCYRDGEGSAGTHRNRQSRSSLDDLPWPKRTTFDTYLGKPIASMLTSRGCWRNCAFCSINAWYERVGGKKFRVRSTASIVAEVTDCITITAYAIFNFQDDNFFLPETRSRPLAASLSSARRLAASRGREIAITVKARPTASPASGRSSGRTGSVPRVPRRRERLRTTRSASSIARTRSMRCCNALRILNDFDVHIAFNLLMFEPLYRTGRRSSLNLRFIERHIDNPFNFCRAEAHAGTGLAEKLSWRPRASCWAITSDSIIGLYDRTPRSSTRSQTCFLTIEISKIAGCTTSTCRWTSRSRCCGASIRQC